MPLTIADFFEQVDGLSIEDAPPELRARIDEELADLTNGITGPQGEPSTGPSPGDPDVVVVDKEGGGDFTSIQDAVDDPDTEPGNTILIRPGTYATGDEVEVTDPGELRLVGSGSGSDPASNTVLEGQLKVLVEEAAGNGVTMRDLRIEGVDDDGAAIDATAAFGGSALREIGVENVTFVNNDFEGLDIQDPAEDLAVRDCLIENNGDNGIEGEDITNAVVSDCTIKNNDGEAIDFNAVDSLVIDGCTIRNNDDGVEFDGDAVDLTVTDSTIASNDSDGVFGNNVNNGTIRNCLIEDNDTEGIDIDGGNNLTIEQCTVRNNGGNGIEFDFTDVGNLTITESVVDNSGDSGVFFDDGEVTDSTIERSNITNSGDFGVEIGSGATVTSLSVVDSYLDGNTDGGVESGSSITTTGLRSKLVSGAGENGS
ncbi:right-handed parallel beta-helix repeat-containing protein [Halobellus ruber]|uniref:Right-handed parallel beta-helix repeat-containing protein n=1 Tax=Halobellus ruber TaxID=2761102 RepID=A0A7J9SKS4_9EURY|nr:right-handed parallel beta-helix repeat-containing protein [Halobellus ruber]MBB6646636.1 right-handed parallel beta-helix repeat-containing protein [Halobellus ruber]